MLGGVALITLSCCGVVGYRALAVARAVLQTTHHDPRVVELLHLPAYQLAYAGAVVLEEETSSGRETGAIATKIYGIPAPIPEGVNAQAVEAWYHQHLLAAGWDFVGTRYPPEYMVEESWHDTGHYLYLGIFPTASTPSFQPAADATNYPLVFVVQVGMVDGQGD